MHCFGLILLFLYANNIINTEAFMDLHINLYGKIVTDYPELTHVSQEKYFFRSKLDLEIDRWFSITPHVSQRGNSTVTDVTM